MATRCKFVCANVKKMKHWNQPTDGSIRFLYEAEFSGVTGGSEENKKFYEATPSSNLKIGIYKEDVFEPGKEYFIDIVEA